MKNLRVLHTEWGDWGGQQIRIILEMEALKKYGIETQLACKKDARIGQEALKRGFKVHFLPFKGNADLITLFGLIKIIKNEKIAIVNTHSGKDTWVGGFAAKFAKVKFIRTRHMSTRINPSRINFINELADFIITTGESIKEDMIKNNRISPDKIVSIPSGQDSNRFNPKKYDKLESRKILNLPTNKKIIGNLALLIKYKRHDIFIKVAKEVLKKYPDILFVIAGDGSEKENLLKMIQKYKLEKNVKLIGFCEKPEIFLSAIDLLLLTSDTNEGIPQVLIQALMMNLPVISSNVGSIKDLWHNNNFDLINNYTIENFTKAVIKNLENPQKKDTREYMIKNFSTEVMAKKTLEVYKRVMNQ